MVTMVMMVVRRSFTFAIIMMMWFMVFVRMFFLIIIICYFLVFVLMTIDFSFLVPIWSTSFSFILSYIICSAFWVFMVIIFWSFMFWVFILDFRMVIILILSYFTFFLRWNVRWRIGFIWIRIIRLYYSALMFIFSVRHNFYINF